jgi:hypothetical protein
MTTRTVHPVRKQIVVRAPQATCFEVFTARMGSWWIPSHSIGDEPQADVVVEPHAGGRWYERGEGGAECDWGRVLVWEPPARVVLAWQIGASWAFDAELRTEVEVRFEATGPESTTVTLEHRGLDGFGDHAEDMRSRFDSEGGWSGLLQRFADTFDG